MRELPFFKILAALAFLGLLVAFQRRGVALREARIEAHNERAARSQSEIVYRDQIRTVAERLAFQTTRSIELDGELSRLLRREGEKTRLLSRLAVSFDSVRGLVTRGEVTGDSAVRHLFAVLDTMGFRAEIQASVPPPPDSALVEWHVSRDPVRVAVALNESPEGQLALRALAEGQGATPTIDSTVAWVESGARHNQRLAKAGLLVLLGAALAKLLLP